MKLWWHGPEKGNARLRYAEYEDMLTSKMYMVATSHLAIVIVYSMWLLEQRELCDRPLFARTRRHISFLCKASSWCVVCAIRRSGFLGRERDTSAYEAANIRDLDLHDIVELSHIETRCICVCIDGKGNGICMRALMESLVEAEPPSCHLSAELCSCDSTLR